MFAAITNSMFIKLHANEISRWYRCLSLQRLKTICPRLVKRFQLININGYKDLFFNKCPVK